MSSKTVAAVALLLLSEVAAAQSFVPVADWPKLPAGRPTIDNVDGDVSAAGDIFVAAFSTFTRLHKFTRR